jgi:hypothetical protein
VERRTVLAGLAALLVGSAAGIVPAAAVLKTGGAPAAPPVPAPPTPEELDAVETDYTRHRRRRRRRRRRGRRRGYRSRRRSASVPGLAR